MGGGRLRALVAGFERREVVAPAEWEVVAQDLYSADALTEFDVVLLRPIMWGGLFPRSFQEQYGASLGWLPDYRYTEGRALQGAAVDLAVRLFEAARLRGSVVVVAWPTETISWRGPDPAVPAADAYWAKRMGDGDRVLRAEHVSNLDVLSPWAIKRATDVAGRSVVVQQPGHAFAPYLELEPMAWDGSLASSDKDVVARVIATDQTGNLPVASEIMVQDVPLFVMPVAAHPNGLAELGAAIDRARASRSARRVRSATEILAEDALRVAEQDLETAKGRCGAAAREVDRARRATEASVAADPVLTEAVADYERGLRERDVAAFYRGYEVLKNASGLDETSFLASVGLSRADKEKITRVANRSDRHPPRGKPGSRVPVADQEFEAAADTLRRMIQTKIP